MNIKELVAEKGKIHSREIKLAAYPHLDDQVIVEGFLEDHRHVPIFDITGRVTEPGVVHRMGIWLILRGNPLAVEDIQAEMMNVPLAQCRETLDTIERVKGLEIKSGFSSRIRRITGGRNGCTHLCHLLTVMGQEMVHGWLTRKREKPAPVPDTMDDLPYKGFLLDSCRMWTRDGPKTEEIRQALEQRKKGTARG